MKNESQESDRPNPLILPLGTLYVTQGIQKLIDEQGLDVSAFIQRHQIGDDGELDEEDKAENQLSIKKGFRILSAYHFLPPDSPDKKIKFWIITEADRSATTALLPEEY